MTTLTAPPVTKFSTPPGPPGAARLRLRRAGAADRWFDLSSGKCTIGSSPRCHVCLPAAEAQPLQCLLSLEAGAAFATKWASGVLLNGQTFAKAAFEAGDRLSIGPWEIEWDPRETLSRETPSRKSEPRAAEPMRSSSTPPTADASRPKTTLRETVDFTPVERVLPKTPAPLTLVEPASARLRETIDFSPVAPAPRLSTPLVDLVNTPAPTTVPPASRQTIVVDSDAVAVEPPASDAVVFDEPTAKRPAAKTMLIASRETDPFADLLGPGKPILAVPTVATPEIAAVALSDAPSFLASQTFEARLVATLWTSNFAARKRAKSLAAAARTARGRVVELTASVATLEGQLATAVAASSAATEELGTKLEALRAELKQALLDRDRAASDLVTLQNARPRTAPPDPRLQTLADAVAKSELEATELRETLATCNEQIETLRQERAAAEGARASAEIALATATAAQAAAEQAQAAAEKLVSDSKAARDSQQLDALAAERTERDQERKIADEEAARLREQLYACESQIEIFRTQLAEVDAARDALADQLASAQQQQADWLAQCRTLEVHRAEQLADMAGQRDELQRQLDELAALPAAAISNTLGFGAAPAPEVKAATWQEPSTAVASGEEFANEYSPTPAALSEPIWRGWDVASEVATEAPEEIGDSRADAGAKEPLPFADAFRRGEENADERQRYERVADDVAEFQPTKELAGEADFAAPVTPVPETAPRAAEAEPETPAKNFTPPSFIDKYKHLLDNEGETPAWTSNQRPLLDEEHMSPSKKTPASSVEEDSDEALEAYMSNMMRRMRNSGGAPAHPELIALEAPEPVLSHVEQLAKAALEAEKKAAEPVIELDANGMLRTVRKQQQGTTDFTALRALANSSARTAIAEHRQRRHMESAVTKSLVCVVASAASAYLMLTSPGVHSPWFWGGCVTMVLAAGAAAQLGGIVWQRLRDGGRTKAGVAAGTAPEGTT